MVERDGDWKRHLLEYPFRAAIHFFHRRVECARVARDQNLGRVIDAGEHAVVSRGGQHQVERQRAEDEHVHGVRAVGHELLHQYASAAHYAHRGLEVEHPGEEERRVLAQRVAQEVGHARVTGQVNAVAELEQLQGDVRGGYNGGLGVGRGGAPGVWGVGRVGHEV